MVTSQKPQRRVHRLPPIMKVAVPRPQHSPRFGQAAEAQTVCSRRSATVRCTASRLLVAGSGALAVAATEQATPSKAPA